MIGLWKTGRQRVVEFNGLLTSSQSSSWSCDNPGTPDAAVTQDTYVRPWYSFGALGAEFFARASEGGTVPLPGTCDPSPGSYGSVMELSYPAFGVGTGVQTFTDGTFTRPGSFSRAVNGSWYARGTFEEYAQISLLLESDLHGFPREPVIDEDEHLVGYGDAQKDGLAGYKIEYFEVAKVGTSLEASITFCGHTLSLTVPITVLNQFELVKSFGGGIDYGFRCANSITVFGTSGTLSQSAELNGIPIVAPWSDSKFDASADASGTCDLWANDTLGIGAYCTSDFALFPASSYELIGRARTFDQPYPSSATVRWLYKKDAFDVLYTKTMTLSPSGTDSYGQLRFGCTADLNGVTADGDAADEWHGVRAWLDEDWLISSGEDHRDWRIQAQLYPWAVLRLSQSETLTISSGATLTQSAKTIPLLYTNLEGYRFLRFSATLTGGSARRLRLKIGEKEFEFTTPGDGVSDNYLIDLCYPASRPSSLKADHRDARYPLTIEGPAYGPNEGKPNVDQEDEEDKGWLMGVLEREATASVEGLRAGESLSIGALVMHREDASHSSVLLPFLAEREGWQSATDTTYLDLDVWLYSDGKPAGPWPARAHVVPGAPEYVWYSLSQMRGFLASTPGWSAALLASPAGSPVLASSPTVKLQSGDREAGHLDPYLWDGGAWRDQTLRELPFAYDDLYAALKFDLVDAYPGCGDPALAHGALTSSFPFRFSKLLRAQAEGQTFKGSGARAGDTIELRRILGGANRGQGISDAQGTYRTGTPWGLGNLGHETILLRGSRPKEGHTTANRYRHRTSFCDPAGTATRPYHLQGEDGRIMQASIDDGDIMFRRSASSVPLPAWAFEGLATDSQDWLSASFTIDPSTQRILMLAEKSDGIYELHSDDDGATWSDPQFLMAGTFPYIGAGPTEGSLFRCWFEFDSGTSGPGKAKGQYREGGDTSWGAVFTFKDDAGADISVAEDGMCNVMQAADEQERWTWSPILDGQSQPTTLFSTDGGRTWTEL